MPAVSGFAITQLSDLPTDQFTPILPPRDFMGVTIVNGSDGTVELATNDEDAVTVVPLLAGDQFMIQAPFAGQQGGTIRFPSGQPAFYLKPASADHAGLYLVWA